MEFDISKAFIRVWNQKLKSSGISGRIFDLILSFRSNRQLPVVLDGKSLQECPVHARDPQDYLLESALFLLYVNEITDGVICNISMLLILLSTVTVIRYLICGKC